MTERLRELAQARAPLLLDRERRPDHFTPALTWREACAIPRRHVMERLSAPAASWPQPYSVPPTRNVTRLDEMVETKTDTAVLADTDGGNRVVGLRTLEAVHLAPPTRRIVNRRSTMNEPDARDIGGGPDRSCGQSPTERAPEPRIRGYPRARSGEPLIPQIALRRIIGVAPGEKWFACLQSGRPSWR